MEPNHNPNGDIILSKKVSGTINCLSFYRPPSPYPPHIDPSEYHLVAGSSTGDLYYWVFTTKPCVPKFTRKILCVNIQEIRWDEGGRKVYVVYKVMNRMTAFFTWNLDEDKFEDKVEIDRGFRIIHRNGIRQMKDGKYDLFRNEDAEVCCADVHFPRIVACTPTTIYTYNHEKENKKRTVVAPPGSTIRTVNIFEDKNGNFHFAVGHSNGKIFIYSFDEPEEPLELKGNKAGLPIREIAIHPIHKTMAVVSEDRVFRVIQRMRTEIKFHWYESKEMNKPITSCDFSAKGDLFAYAVSDDDPNTENYVFIGNLSQKFIPHPTNL